jgi:uncharacterized protein
VNIFVDTSALYAVLDGNDGRHADAVATWAELLRAAHELLTTNYVLLEIVALAQTRMGMEAVSTLSSDLLPMIRTIWVDDATHRSAVHAHLVSARRKLSLVDCVSFETMRRASLKDAFCLDPHFAEQGFRTLPA